MILAVINVKNINFIDALLTDANIQIVDMQKGLTNRNFLLTLNDQQYVFRTPYADASNIVNRHHETLALKALENTQIDVETIYYDEASGYKVTKYLPDAYTYQECPYEDKIERVALLMKQFHSLHTSIHVEFDPIARYQQYQSHVKTPLHTFTMLDTILEELKAMHHPHILCHNDWVDGNILFTKDQTYLIDYEYAADNDPLFDVISFLSENNIYDETLRTRFYQTYFDDFNDEIQKDLYIYEAFEDALWCTWANMMWDSRHDEIYKEIAQAKYDAYQVVIKQWMACNEK